MALLGRPGISSRMIIAQSATALVILIIYSLLPPPLQAHTTHFLNGWWSYAQREP